EALVVEEVVEAFADQLADVAEDVRVGDEAERLDAELSFARVNAFEHAVGRERNEPLQKPLLERLAKTTERLGGNFVTAAHRFVRELRFFDDLPRELARRRRELLREELHEHFVENADERVELRRRATEELVAELLHPVLQSVTRV